MRPLVKAGINFEVDHKAIHRSKEIQAFNVHKKLNRNVVLLRLFPSIRTETVEHFLKPPIEGVVLQCYGAGNIPSNRADVMDLLAEAVKRGVIIITVTQCTHGGVSDLYATGKILLDIGILPGNDLTTEAALTKLAYVLSKTELTMQQKRNLMVQNIAGEITVMNLSDGSKQLERQMSTDRLSDSMTALANVDDFDLIQSVADQLQIKTSQEVEKLREILFPSIVNAIVHSGHISKLEIMKDKYEADLTLPNYDGRTPLHVAAAEGHVATVDYLLRHGAGVHVRDRSNETPLMCAINERQRDTIRTLRACGAHLQLGSLEIGEKLCSLARLGEKKKISCFKLAGADLNTLNMSGQTALHAASETGQVKVARYLLENNVDKEIRDAFGRTALDIAKALNRPKMTELLSQEIKPVQQNVTIVTPP